MNHHTDPQPTPSGQPQPQPWTLWKRSFCRRRIGPWEWLFAGTESECSRKVGRYVNHGVEVLVMPPGEEPDHMPRGDKHWT
jgi:hypothetical protein